MIFSSDTLKRKREWYELNKLFQFVKRYQINLVSQFVNKIINAHLSATN